MRLLRMVLAFAAWPFAFALSLAFADAVRMASSDPSASFPAELLALLGGMVAQLLVWAVLPKPVRAYVLGHELTHAVCALLFGAKVGRLKVSDRGGSVGVSKSNVWITLSPYFVPFYTVVVVLAALVTRCFVSPLPWPCAWTAAVGFTWAFHVCFTLRSLGQYQSDVAEYGRVFSWTFIWVFNLAGMLLWLACTTSASIGGIASAVWSHSVDAYVWIYESVRALPFLSK